MMGFDCAYVPGWDCHGLPIEHKVMTELQDGDKLAKLETLPEDQRKMAIRRECQKYAEKFVKLQQRPRCSGFSRSPTTSTPTSRCSRRSRARRSKCSRRC
jgi:valyl-tRNA synthetase